MKLITCEVCGKHYDFDRDESCPKCGAYTHPNHANTAVPAQKRPNTSFSSVRIGTSVRPSMKKPVTKKNIAIVIAIITALHIGGSIIGGLVEMFHSESTPEYMAAQEGSLIEMQEDDFGNGDYSDHVTYTPYDGDLYRFKEADGVCITVDGYGTMQGEPVTAVADAGEKCLYLDTTFSVTDFDLAAQSVITEPYLQIEGDYYFPTITDVLLNSGDCSPMDYTLIREGEDEVYGELYYIIPADATSFTLCWDSSNGVEMFSMIGLSQEEHSNV